MKLPKPLVQMSVVIALAFGSAFAAEDPAAKIDSGLGELPPYSEWKDHPELARFATSGRTTQVKSNRVRGEKLDSGLGDLPPYSEWKKHPELARLVVKPEGAPLALRSHE